MAQNTATERGGGIHSIGGTVTLANSENVTNNTPDNCGGNHIDGCDD